MFQYMIYREFILVRFQKTLQIYAIDFETLLMTSNNFALEEKTKNTEHRKSCNFIYTHLYITYIGIL